MRLSLYTRAYRRSIKARGHHNFANTPPTFARTPIRARERGEGERRKAGAHACTRCVRATASHPRTHARALARSLSHTHAYRNRPMLTPQSCSERFCIRYAETHAPSLYRGLPGDLAILRSLRRGFRVRRLIN